jgi:hypothetical protein
MNYDIAEDRREEHYQLIEEITSWVDNTPSMKVAQVFITIRGGELFDHFASAILRYPKLLPDEALKEYILDTLVKEHEAWYALS